MLVFGPVSDRFGRRPALCDYMLYAVEAWCARLPLVRFSCSPACRGLGAGGASSVSMAVVKDAFDAEHRGSVLGITVLSSGRWWRRFWARPSSTLGWRASFWALTVGAAALAASFLKTIPDEGRVKAAWAWWRDAWRRWRATRGSCCSWLPPAPELSFMAYVAVASYVYMGTFGRRDGLQPVLAAALVGIAGPALYAASQAHGRAAVHHRRIGAGAGGRLLSTVGVGDFWRSVWRAWWCPSCRPARPYATNILLEQQRNDTAPRQLISFVRRHSIACSCRFCPGRTT
ncbi:MAG: hypothetical protein ACLSVD_12355 [Eggerthellaceae bacterium]